MDIKGTGFAEVVRMIMENRSFAEVADKVDSLEAEGKPITAKEAGISDNMLEEMSEEMVSAIKTADAIGKEGKAML